MERFEWLEVDNSSPYVFLLTLYVGSACCGESSTLSTSFQATIRLLNEHKKRDLVSPYAPENMTIPC
ncbi:hypothetical protein K469DRAFT_700416, partial [Zopfia rhizophila CBS 207.26]